jgi:tRNA 2-thiouridine synthesizing protein A
MKDLPAEVEGLPDGDEGSPERTRGVMEAVARLSGSFCRTCGSKLCGHAAVFCIVMGFADAPVCPRCLAAGLDWPLEGLRDRLSERVRAKACLRAGWREAGEREGFGDVVRPACLWPAGEPSPAGAAPSAEPGPAAASIPTHDAEWDAADLGCGDLVLDLRARLMDMAPGQILKLTARDPGAPEDMPAWCGLTGHRLLAAKHPLYWIRKKEK